MLIFRRSQVKRKVITSISFSSGMTLEHKYQLIATEGWYLFGIIPIYRKDVGVK